MAGQVPGSRSATREEQGRELKGDCWWCRYGEEGLKGGAGGMGGAGQYANPFDIFESFFGGGGGGGGFGGQPGRNPRNQPQQGNDERHDMVIDFSQAVFGCRYDPQHCIAFVGRSKRVDARVCVGVNWRVFGCSMIPSVALFLRGDRTG